MTVPSFAIRMITIDCADPARLATFWAAAREHETHTVPGLTWTVMTDPEDNVFRVGNPDE